MRKIVFVTTIPSPYRVHFFNELGKVCDLTVIFEKMSSSDRDDVWKRFNAQNFKSIFLKGISIKANKAFCPNILKELKKMQYDVLVLGGYNTPTAMLVAEWLRKKKIPYILNADGGYVKEDKPFIEKLKKRYISSAAMWICTSEKTKEYFLHYGAKRDFIFKYPFTSMYEKDILTKPLTREQKIELRNEIGMREEKIVVTVGQFIYRKGFDLLLKAHAKLPCDIGLYLIGGKETEEYSRIVQDYGLRNVHFISFITTEELSKYYKAADLFAFPTREDIWGLVINEATAYGLPIVTTNECMAGVEMVTDNGTIIPTEDVDKLAEAISRILKSQSKKEAMAEASLEIAREYTFEKMVEAHLSIIEEFVKRFE